MTWLELSVVCDAAQADALEATLADAGALSLGIDDAGDGPLFEPAPGEHPLWRQCRLSALFDDRQVLAAAVQRISDVHGVTLASRLEQREFAERDWLTETQSALPASRFGRRLWVVPPGTPPPSADAVCVELVPGLAFGTGAHESTALCLEWLDGQDLDGAEVVDFGCGSGILAIAAARLGARRVHAVDHDPQALTATRDNADANRVGSRIVVGVDASLDTTPCADLLVANILAGTLVTLAPRILALLRPGGRFALAGILAHQADDVCAAYRFASEGVELTCRGEWVCLSAVRAGSEAG